MSKIFSHINKELQVHLKGVLEKSQKRGFSNLIIEYASLFHDIAKTNINFQNKLFGKKFNFANHSYLSTYISIYLLYYNTKIKEKYLKIFNDNKISLNIISNIITRHHSDLRNIDNIFEDSEINNVKILINGNDSIDFVSFINDNFEDFNDNSYKFDRKFKDILFKGFCENKDYIDIWKSNSLKNYFDTTFNFSQLIEADKRDASNNSIYLLDDINKYNYLLNNNLNKFLDNLKIDSKLNEIRTEIRNDAVFNLSNKLKKKYNRMFELTAPTGSGKTFMMLKLANVIQQEVGDYGIIMTLPFTSIIDQSSSICENELMLDVLNYTSSSNCSSVIEKLLKDENNLEYNIKNLINYNFSEETFDHPFVITTFVQFFQTLIANKNSVLIKLPNFTKRIFLIDEFQSIPNSLYTFFYGVLQYFCETYDCYCILSTATMPNFELNSKKTSNNMIDPHDVFKTYKEPEQLLDSNKYYTNDIFNRYIIENIGDEDLLSLTDEVTIRSNIESVLVVMNTVKDSIDLYNNTVHDNKYLLNSNFTTIDKQRIINEVKNDLKINKNVLLITTQIVEAGVDIDFPVEYRDLCPLPSLIQSAGRCNRNGKLDIGYVYLFKYYELDKKNKKKYKSSLIYEKYDLTFVDNNIKIVYEKELLDIQKTYYYNITNYKEVGRVGKFGKNENENLLELLHSGKIEDLGQYRLIANDDEQKTYYVGDEFLWNDFKTEYNSMINIDYDKFKVYKIKLSRIHKQILKYCVNVRINKDKNVNIPYSDEIMGIRNLSDKSIYNSNTGFDKNSIEITFI